MQEPRAAGKVLGLIRLPVSGLDDRGVTVGYIDPPGFCSGSTEDEINRAHDGDKSVFVYDLARHKSAKNPSQCETARLYDLATDRWYRESPTSMLKNIGAGFVNSIIPGSDLGDRGSSTQMVGGFIGSVFSLGVPTGVTGLAAKITGNIAQKSSSMSVLNNIISGFNRAVSSPLGQIGTNFLSGLIQPAPAPTPMMAGTGASPTTTVQPVRAIIQTAEKYLPSITEPKSTMAGALAFGDVKVGDYSIEKKTSVPWYAWAIGGVLLLGTILVFVFKRKRR